MNLGVQYYRPPFPNPRYWRDDLAQIAAAGLNTLQLWVVWSWVEPSPGEYLFDDYDRLVEMAHDRGLGVVLSTIAAVHPYWIHREVPGSEMIDNMGHKVISSNRGEIHFGLTPGGCTDHPGVWARMRGFLEQVVTRYRAAPNLRGWDAWNELRWNVQADGLVCYCPHTMRAFRDWLDARYGGLEGLNAAWQRRYRAWDEVMPGKMPNRPYTEMMAFEHFMTWRATEHGKARYDLIKSLDPDHLVTVHGGQPTVMHGDAYPVGTALHRGNDWTYADHMDGIGCSSFPVWQGADDAALTARLSYLTSAARGKHIWLSELQGGRASSGFQVHSPVRPGPQQRWVWTGIAGGADTILFWCWRDEVFGRESAGFGLSGNDGFAEQRLAAMRKTGGILRRHAALLDGYQPDAPRVGIYFSPQSYYLHWAQDGSGRTAQHALEGYARALVRGNVPYTVVEEEHLACLDGLDVLFMPRVLVIDEPQAEALSAFVRRGGVLVAESECGAYGSNGLYRYPEDRFLAQLTGIREIGRRTLDQSSVRFVLGRRAYDLPVAQWLTPLHAGRDTVLATGADGPLAVEHLVDRGRVLLCGTYMGDAYHVGQAGDPAYAPHSADFEAFLQQIVRGAGVRPAVEVLSTTPAGSGMIHATMGRSEERRMAFVFFDEACESARLRFPSGAFYGKARDLISDQVLRLTHTSGGEECDLVRPEWGFMVLVHEL
ncbi:MAG: beta-galactosidase [Anaerolineae bacterium]|nr:beta-galactosidase [Anaerolineae bacterium]